MGTIFVDNIKDNVGGKEINIADGSLSVDSAGKATFTTATTITTDDNTTQLTLKSTDADSNLGPILDLLRDGGSPADSDLILSLIHI